MRGTVKMFNSDCLDSFGVRAVEVLVKLTVLALCRLLCFGFQYWVMCFKLLFVLVGFSLSYLCTYLC